ADAIFPPDPILSLCRRERVRRIGVDPFGPFRSVEVAGAVAPRGQLPDHRGFSGSGHARNQDALHGLSLVLPTGKYRLWHPLYRLPWTPAFAGVTKDGSSERNICVSLLSAARARSGIAHAR